MALATLSRVMLIVRSPAAAARFYGLIGLPILVASEGVVQLAAGPALRLDLVAGQNEAVLSTGYSPVLSFTVPQDRLAELVPQLIMRGAHLDGAISHRPHETVACLRTPDGHIIAIVEPSATAAPAGHGLQ